MIVLVQVDERRHATRHSRNRTGRLIEQSLGERTFPGGRDVVVLLDPRPSLLHDHTSDAQRHPHCEIHVPCAGGIETARQFRGFRQLPRQEVAPNRGGTRPIQDQHVLVRLGKGGSNGAARCQALIRTLDGAVSGGEG